VPRASSPKARIGAAFGCAREYDAQAAIQAEAARVLAGLVLERGLPPHPSVLDMGCGTGNVALALGGHTGQGLYLCADLSPAMLARARGKLAEAGDHAPYAAHYAAMDAERPALRGAFDLVISSMALQWTTNLAATVAGVWSLVRPGGLLAFALPGPETFREWRQAHQRLGLACGLWEYPDATALRAMLPAVAVTIREERRSVSFRRALDFPRHLKALGGFVPRPGHAPLPPVRFRAVLAELDAVFPNGPRLTYQLFYALASKPGQG